MKCRACWADKAYIHPVKGWRGTLLSCVFLVPLKCHHCYHKFCVPAFSTWGKQLMPPTLRVSKETQSGATVASLAAQRSETRPTSAGATPLRRTA